MRVFADSSAVVKLYSDEHGAGLIRQLESMYVAEIARVEVPAALWRKSRTGAIGEAACSQLVEMFEDDFHLDSGSLVPITTGRTILEHAAVLAGTRGLRAYDAVQLATALQAADIDPDCRTVATFDAELAEAVQQEGLLLLT